MEEGVCAPLGTWTNFSAYNAGSAIKLFLLIYVGTGQNLVFDQELLCQEEKVLLY